MRGLEQPPEPVRRSLAPHEEANKPRSTFPGMACATLWSHLIRTAIRKVAPPPMRAQARGQYVENGPPIPIPCRRPDSGRSDASMKHPRDGRQFDAGKVRGGPDRVRGRAATAHAAGAVPLVRGTLGPVRVPRRKRHRSVSAERERQSVRPPVIARRSIGSPSHCVEFP